MSVRRAVVSGGTGFVGRFLVERLLAEGFAVTVLGRSEPAPGYFSGPVAFVEMALGDGVPKSVFREVTVFVHAALDHVEGRYRGGEGSDPGGFRRRNLDGSLALFEAARDAGVARAVFLSSRAVYGTQPAGAVLDETTEPHPDTLYSALKLEAEQRLLGMASAKFVPAVLRVTGVYGPAGRGKAHKWQPLFGAFLAGDSVPSRVATEVHGDDVAAAVALMAGQPADVVSGEVFNVSDIVLDHRDLLGLVADATGAGGRLPERADASALNVMATVKLRALGWRPGGEALLRTTVAGLLRDHV